MLPLEVINQVTKICRNFFWGGNEHYKRPPYVALDMVCTLKKQEGLGVKNLSQWSMACAAKLVWAIAMKEDSLWVKWFHGRYLRGSDWWQYTPKSDTSWYWKKLVKVKERFWAYPKGEYTVKQGYGWVTQVAKSQTGQTWYGIDSASPGIPLQHGCLWSKRYLSCTG